ncbi:MAG: Rdx family protein [Phycisphaerales bacterium]|nr:Rdx family protein [Phycisphaerales bacterium]
MAAAIKDAYDLEAQLIPGDGGIFDVKADGSLLFSKKQAGRFPEHHEVLDRLGALLKR